MQISLKKLTGVLLALIMVLGLAACGNAGQETSTGQTANAAKETINSSNDDLDATEKNESEVTDKEITNQMSGMEQTPSDESGKILVVYFSWSGHLDTMAHWVADETDGDLYRVMAADPYPEDYDATADRAKQERDDGVRPEIVVDITPELMSKYDTIFFGFPVWWYDLPMPMWTFLENYDFSGKTIIPFFSHEGSSNGASALPTVEELAVGATVRSDEALSIRGGNVDGSEDDVRAWVHGLNLE